MQNENNTEQNNVSASNSAHKPRAKSAAATASWLGIIAGSVGLDAMTTQSVKKHFKEQPSDWAKHAHGDNYLTTFRKSFAKLADPKQWKSSAVSLAILIPGGMIASHTKRTMEENAYQNNAKNNHLLESEALKEMVLDVATADDGQSITEVEHQGKLEQPNKQQAI